METYPYPLPFALFVCLSQCVTRSPLIFLTTRYFTWMGIVEYYLGALGGLVSYVWVGWHFLIKHVGLFVEEGGH